MLCLYMHVRVFIIEKYSLTEASLPPPTKKKLMKL